MSSRSLRTWTASSPTAIAPATASTTVTTATPSLCVLTAPTSCRRMRPRGRPDAQIATQVDFGADRDPPPHPPDVTPAELDAVARESRPRLVRLASKLVPHRVAEDVAQEALAALAKAAGDVPIEKSGAFLTKAVSNQALAAWRGIREVPVDSSTVPEPASDETPETTLRSFEIAAEVQRELRRMPAGRRAVVVGVLAEGRTQAEVAEMERIPESKLRVWLAKGAEDLRGAFTRSRASEKRRSGGFSSWAVIWAIADARRMLRALWPSSVRAAIRPAAAALGAITLGGVLHHLGSVETLAPTEDELPARAAEVAPVRWAESTALALPGVEREAASAVPATGPRKRHDIGERVLRERLAHP